MRMLGPRGVAMLASALVVTGSILPVTSASAATTFSTTTAWSWVYTPLSTTTGADQVVTARITGLSDKDKNGAFQLRAASSTTFVRANFSGTRYQLSTSANGTYTAYVDIPFVPGVDGTARVELTGTVVKAYWNNALVDTHDIAALASFTGTGTGLGIWQNKASAVSVIDATATSPAVTVTPTFTSTTTWSWVTSPLTTTTTNDQTATARVTGLSDKDKNAAFLLRRSPSGYLRATFSGARYQVSGTVNGVTTTYVDIPFVPGTDGTAKVQVVGPVVTAYWNGSLVSSKDVAEFASYTGTDIALGIWQNSPSVAFWSATGAVVPAPAAAPLGAVLSGASGDGVSSGAFGTWRGTPVQIAGAWNDSYAEQTKQYAVQPGAPYGSWNKDLDLAIGGIFKNYGQTWAAAASGAYDSRWTTAFQNIKKGWGSRTGTLWIRFAHEFNGDWVPWSVTGAEAPAFVTTWRRVYGIMKSILPNAKMVFSPNDGSARALNLDWRTAWPGAAYVDVIGVDTYNQYPYVADTTTWLTKIWTTDYYGAPVGIERYRAFAESVGRPMALAEWATNASMGDGAVYMQLMRDWIAAHRGTAPGQVAYEVYFNVSGSYNGVFQIYPRTTQPNAAAAYVNLF